MCGAHTFGHDFSPSSPPLCCLHDKRQFSELFRASVELFWEALKSIFAIKQLLGTSLGAANGTLKAHKHSTGSVDRDLGALGGVLETSLVASGCPSDPQSLENRCRRLVRTGFASILSSPHLKFKSQHEISRSYSSSRSTSAAE